MVYFPTGQVTPRSISCIATHRYKSLFYNKNKGLICYAQQVPNIFYKNGVSILNDFYYICRRCHPLAELQLIDRQKTAFSPMICLNLWQRALAVAAPIAADHHR